MPQKRQWTAPQDARLRRLRAEGATWDQIAADLELGRSAVIERGHRIAAHRPTPAQTAEHQDPALHDPQRPPMHPGHPVTWGAITETTCLAGTEYGAEFQ